MTRFNVILYYFILFILRNVRGWVLFRAYLSEIPELGIFADGCYDMSKRGGTSGTISYENAILASNLIIDRHSELEEGSVGFARKYMEISRIGTRMVTADQIYHLGFESGGQIEYQQESQGWKISKRKLFLKQEAELCGEVLRRIEAREKAVHRLRVASNKLFRFYVEDIGDFKRRSLNIVVIVSGNNSVSNNQNDDENNNNNDINNDDNNDNNNDDNNQENGKNNDVKTSSSLKKIVNSTKNNTQPNKNGNLSDFSVSQKSNLSLSQKSDASYTEYFVAKATAESLTVILKENITDMR